jgi:hypothetical protein
MVARGRLRKKKARVGRCWAERLWWVGSALEFPKKIGMGYHGNWAELMDWIGGPAEIIFKFISRILIQIKEF